MSSELQSVPDAQQSVVASTAAPPSTEQYTAVLRDYLHAHSEDALYRASLLSRGCIEAGLGPEEIVSLHGEAFALATGTLSYREQARAGTDALAFLLEVMIAYGVQHQELVEVSLSAERARTQAALGAQEQLMAKAHEAERTMTDSLAMIAHELRTPLMAALSNVDLVLRVMESGDTQRVPRFLGSAREALLRLSRLSGELLDVSRGHPPELDRSPVELPVVLSQACTWASTVAEAKGIEIVRAGGPFSLRVLGDEDALLTVFGNLLSNAIRYTQAGSVTVQHWAEDGKAIVEIKDTGVGIPEGEMERIFEGFYRGADARHLETEGLGLGLTLAQRFAELQGGQIQVESVVGTGSTFRVVLPLMPGTEEQPK
ncbi:MAG: hypothetical protein NVS1B1_01360 [Candidatus Limnocylindrales bacterium]